MHHGGRRLPFLRIEPLRAHSKWSSVADGSEMKEELVRDRNQVIRMMVAFNFCCFSWNMEWSDGWSYARQLNKIRWKTVGNSVRAASYSNTRFFASHYNFMTFAFTPSARTATVATKERKARFSVTKLMDAFCTQTKKIENNLKSFYPLSPSVEREKV